MNKAIVILGPTASGKTALALELSKYLNIEIISLDSALIYKDMDIGTAKPTKEELAIVPHHLIDICDPKDSYSAAQFRNDCIKLVDEITNRGHVPVICGGTMMYYKALVDGLSPIPTSTKEVRDKVEALASDIGWPAVHQMLKDIDEPTYLKLQPNDKQRVSRAMEVFYMTGKPMSSFFTKKQDKCPFERYEFILLPETDDRTKLREQIRLRFEKMVDDGLVDEVLKLKNRGDLNISMTSIKCVGYRQVWEYLDGAYDKDEMINLCVYATSHLAKHQMTWLRGSLANDNNQKVKQKLLIGAKDNIKIILDNIKPYFDEKYFKN